jgi:shikimate kinase
MGIQPEAEKPSDNHSLKERERWGGKNTICIMNIYLIGYRCTGKTSVGKILAKSLNLPFVDADAAVEKENGMTISEMVASFGWNYFREKEKTMIRGLSALGGQVIATGGGVILDPENVRRMKETGRVVWLKAGAEAIEQRLLADVKTADQRPSLTGKKLTDEIKETLEIRTPLYENAADFSVDADDMPVDAIAQKVADVVQKSSRPISKIEIQGEA